MNNQVKGKTIHIPYDSRTFRKKLNADLDGYQIADWEGYARIIKSRFKALSRSVASQVKDVKGTSHGLTRLEAVSEVENLTKEETIIPTISGFEWNTVLDTENFYCLHCLFDLLISFHLMVCTWDYFIIHFTGYPKIDAKIVWFGCRSTLRILFKELRGLELIPKVKHPNVQLSNHFKDEYGSIEPDILRSSTVRGGKSKDEKDKVKKIVSDLRGIIQRTKQRS